MNNMNTISLPEDVWNTIFYDLHATKLQSLAVCSKEINCFLSRNEGLQLYKSISYCTEKLQHYWNGVRVIFETFKETLETSIKIHEYHYLNPITITHGDIESLNLWTHNVIKNGKIINGRDVCFWLVINDIKTCERFLLLEEAKKKINLKLINEQ